MIGGMSKLERVAGMIKPEGTKDIKLCKNCENGYFHWLSVSYYCEHPANILIDSVTGERRNFLDIHVFRETRCGVDNPKYYKEKR